MVDPERIPVVGSFVRALTPETKNDIPILGDVWHGLNSVINFIEYGCYPHWTVWVDCLWGPLTHAVIQIFSFGLGDILRGYFRPTNLRGIGGFTRLPVRNRGGKAGKFAKIRRYATPPEIGNEIGKKLPGSEFFQGRKVTGKERYVWVIDTEVQRFLWYWMVADITDDFITEWTTAIMKSEACAAPDPGSLSAHKDGPVTMFPNIWSGFGFWDVDSRTGDMVFNSGAGQIVIPDHSTCVITFFATSGPGPLGTSEGNQLSVADDPDNSPAGETTVWPVGEGDDPLQTCLTCTVKGPRTVSLRIKPIGTGQQFGSNARVTATLIPDFA